MNSSASNFLNPLLKKLNVGFVGAGNMTQALIRRFVESGTLKPEQIHVSNRTPGKLIKVKELYHVNVYDLNELVVEKSDIVILSVKPQDMNAAIERLVEHFTPEQTIISLATGITMRTLEKLISQPRIVRVMPNTPTLIGRGVLGFFTSDKSPESLPILIKDLFQGFGLILEVENEDQFDALTVSCSAGTGFVFEMMMYWQEWIQEHGFSPDLSKKMTIETFIGASMLAAESMGIDIEELQNKVTSKKGVTAAGLNSMRELEIERALRISFEKAALRSQELSRESRP
jgi:pyrroline-5-carboxylate reductase